MASRVQSSTLVRWTLLMMTASGGFLSCDKDKGDGSSSSSCQKSAQRPALPAQHSSEEPSKDELRRIGIHLQEPVVLTTYEDDIAPLIEEHCLRCHGDDGNAPNLSSWANLATNDLEIAVKAVSAVTSRQMPQDDVDALKPDDRRKFSLWQQQGFRKNENSRPRSNKRPTWSSYQQLAPTIQSMCLNCHGPKRQEPDFSDWNQLKADDFAIAREVVKEVVSGDMPKLRRLSSHQIARFEAWGELGFPETDQEATNLYKEKFPPSKLEQAKPGSGGDVSPSSGDASEEPCTSDKIVKGVRGFGH